MTKGWRRYWGYLVFAALIAAWPSPEIGPPVLIVLSLLVTVFFLFRAPVWCCAVNRDGTLCRNNSYGLLLGCSKRQHKWQKVKMTVVPHAWKQLNRGLWASPREGLTTLGAVTGVVSSVLGMVVLFVRV